MTVQKYKDHNINKHIHTHNHQIAVSYPTNNLLDFADVKLIRNICISACNVYLVQSLALSKQCAGKCNSLGRAVGQTSHCTEHVKVEMHSRREGR